MDMMVDPLFAGTTVYLRGLEEGDLPLRPKWFNDPEINCTLLMETPVSLATTKHWFSRIVPQQNTGRVDLTICDAADGNAIGMTGLLKIDRIHQHAQFYITIGEKAYWGRHIPDEVIPLVLRLAFSVQNLNKVYLWTIPNNARARAVYERNGFQQEGVLRQHFYCRGAFQDIYQHGLLRSDWLRKSQ